MYFNFTAKSAAAINKRLAELRHKRQEIDSPRYKTRTSNGGAEMIGPACPRMTPAWMFKSWQRASSAFAIVHYMEDSKECKKYGWTDTPPRAELVNAKKTIIKKRHVEPFYKTMLKTCVSNHVISISKDVVKKHVVDHAFGEQNM